MYESFFGLGDLPFRLTPDPRYLFMSAKHREAFAHLVYGIREGSGFVAITGEVGAGKTTLIRALLAEHAKDVTVASIVNPVLTSTELLQTINAELGLPSRSTSRKELTEELAGFLRRNRDEGRRTVVIVDEAQNLDPVVLEQLRLLTNLETETEKLLQVVLVGQPELHGILERHDLRQLNQRVTERWHLDKLDRDEAMEYVRHRLRVAGAKTDLVDPKALDLLYRYTDGVPRLLNVLAHRSLLVAFTKSRGRVGADEIVAAARELGYAPRVAAAAAPAWMRLALGVAAAAAVAGVAFLMLEAPVDESADRPRPERAEAPRRVRDRERPPRDEAAVAAAPAAEPVAAAVAIPTPTPTLAAAQDSAAAAAAAADTATLATLAQAPMFETAVADYSRLLDLWGAAPVADGDLAGGSLDLGAIAAARGLRYFAVEMNGALLALLDVPALVEIVPADGAAMHYVLLRRFDRATGRVEIGSSSALGLASFEKSWNGRAHLVFRDPGELRVDLGPGGGGPAVRKLQDMLREAGVYDGHSSGLYDDLTENAVRRFQESRHVAVDGLAGPITQLLLYNSLGQVARPTLSADASPVKVTP